MLKIITSKNLWKTCLLLVVAGDGSLELRCGMTDAASIGVLDRARLL
jgi:hypothetical protein